MPDERFTNDKRDGFRDIEVELKAIKELLLGAARLTRGHEDQIPESDANGITDHLLAFCARLNDRFERLLYASPDLVDEIGARVQQELLSIVLLAKSGDRLYCKPRGYAGDFLSIDWIYGNQPEGAGRLGTVIDRFLLNMPAARAVRNRRGLLVEEIKKTVEAAGASPTRILSLACGPAREIFDAFDALADPGRLEATCLDIDLQALAFVASIRDQRRLKDNIRLEQRNLAHLVLGRQHLDVAPMHLVYSIGLIDYFKDDFVVKLLNFIHERLTPGGRVVLGNFHPANPSKAFMDHVLEWRLIHRDEADMNRLFKSSKFGSACEEVRYEAEGINLFAIGRRPVAGSIPSFGR